MQVVLMEKTKISIKKEKVEKREKKKKPSSTMMEKNVRYKFKGYGIHLWL